MNQNLKLAITDLVTGFLSWRIWLLLAWQDIRLRYRRSQLGPFWITISMAVTIYTMGFLYGHLFKIELAHYFPFLAAGLITWSLLSTIINESTISLVDAAGYLRQMKLPFVVFPLRIITRNFIIFTHNLVPIIPILVYYNVHLGWSIFGLFLGLFIILVNGVVFGLTLGMLGARFRDITQVVASLIQVIFFMTPIMWSAEVLPERYRYVIKFNPFAQFINLVRAPLTGNWPSGFDYFVTVSFSIGGIIVMLYLFSRFRRRIIYWL